jgi:hypothetical protein
VVETVSSTMIQFPRKRRARRVDCRRRHLTDVVFEALAEPGRDPPAGIDAPSRAQL